MPSSDDNAQSLERVLEHDTTSAVWFGLTVTAYTPAKSPLSIKSGVAACNIVPYCVWSLSYSLGKRRQFETKISGIAFIVRDFAWRPILRPLRYQTAVSDLRCFLLIQSSHVIRVPIHYSRWSPSTCASCLDSWDSLATAYMILYKALGTLCHHLIGISSIIDINRR